MCITQRIKPTREYTEKWDDSQNIIESGEFEYDAAGNKIMDKTEQLPVGVSQLSIQTKTLPAGIYILTIKGDEISFREKLIKIN